MTYRIADPNAVKLLAAIRDINKSAEIAQQQQSSGLRIATAADDATYWSFANVMTSDMASYTNISDALGVSKAKVETAYTAASSMIDQLTTIQKALTTAKEKGADRNKLNDQIDAAKENLKTITLSANFAGENWLYNSDAVLQSTRSAVAGFTRDPNGNFVLQTIDYPASDAMMIDTSNAARGLLTKDVDASKLNTNDPATTRNYFLLNVGATTPPSGSEIKLGTATTDSQIDDMVSVVNSLLTSLTSSSAGLGKMSASIDSQKDYVDNIRDSLHTSIGALVDADMEDVAARRTALTTQQKLSLEAMNILNTSTNKVLILLQ